tara:strand:+ start:1583 stop:1801 length:219 start_codon:yes stop_codon:yes gene_type:complete
MLNPFSTIIAKLLGKKDITPELKIDEYNNYEDTHLKQELESVRNKETIRDDATSQRIKRRRQSIRRNSRSNS